MKEFQTQSDLILGESNPSKVWFNYMANDVNIVT